MKDEHNHIIQIRYFICLPKYNTIIPMLQRFILFLSGLTTVINSNK